MIELLKSVYFLTNYGCTLAAYNNFRIRLDSEIADFVKIYKIDSLTELHTCLEEIFGSTSKQTASKTALPNILKITSNHCISSKD